MTTFCFCAFVLVSHYSSSPLQTCLKKVKRTGLSLASFHYIFTVKYSTEKLLLSPTCSHSHLVKY